ncbi:MAG: response regulator, partial [Desulfomonilia bacterium]|nr:response regulator [Desulfomonilia bacterium]
MAEEHILIVEDEEKIAGLLQDYLEKSGYRTSILDRGDAVVSFVKHKAPDLILLDIMLPGLDGMEVCREVRKFCVVP